MRIYLTCMISIFAVSLALYLLGSNKLLTSYFENEVDAERWKRICAKLVRGLAFHVVCDRLVVQSVYRSDSVNFPNGVGLSRADWQSSCAILASKVVSQEQPTEKPGAAGGGGAAGGAGHVAAVNGHSIDLDLVPISTDSNHNKPHQLAHKALTITDLSPALMHGSQLRVAYQGVPGAYSEAAAGKAYPNCEAIPCDKTANMYIKPYE
ncbi:arogenate dehydratase 3-like [Corylus avellana]|uniref:arogenate dehydratase 3-like n=1 Tax=Corylus avellana TaxID=13451 RepID=UPI00286BC8C1|nr:arogenate dehydratase 3-like [Corylus avellana]